MKRHFINNGPRSLCVDVIFIWGNCHWGEGFASRICLSKKTVGPSRWTPSFHTLSETNMTMENPPFEDVYPIEIGDFPMSFVSFRGMCPFPNLPKSTAVLKQHSIKMPDLWGHHSINKINTGWWLQTFFMFTPKIGEDEPILTSIFFKWVETAQLE